MSLANTLTALGARAAEIRRAAPADAGPRMAADAFTVFKLFPVPNETRLSLMLAWLLDPRGSHGAGTLFLERFLSGLGGPWSGLDLAGAVIRLEDPTRDIEQQDRRIDIVIDGQGWVLGIENKPWAADQQAQVADYLRQLETQARIRGSLRRQQYRHGLVYLSGRGEAPKAHSIAPDELARRQAASELLLRSYANVEEWVDWCYQECADPEARIFIGHLLRHIRYRFLDYKDMSVTKPLVDAALENSDALRVAIDYARLGLARLGQELIGRLVKQLGANVPAGWTVHQEESPDVGPWIELRFDDSPHIAFAMRFETTSRFIDLRCGVKGRPGKKLSAPALTTAMNAAFGVARTNEWWPWFTEVHEQNVLLPLPRDWEASNEPWVMIHEGLLHPLVIEAAMRTHGVLEAAGLLGLNPDAPSTEAARDTPAIAPVS